MYEQLRAAIGRVSMTRECRLPRTTASQALRSSQSLHPGFNNGLDPDATKGAIDLVYALPDLARRVCAGRPPTSDGVLAQRRAVHDVFITESSMDELAAAAEQDPIACRRAMLDKAPRAKAVLELVARKPGSGRSLPERVVRGLSVQYVSGPILAQVAEVEVWKDEAVCCPARRVRDRVRQGRRSRTVRAQIQSQSSSASRRRCMARSR